MLQNPCKIQPNTRVFSPSHCCILKLVALRRVAVALQAPALEPPRSAVITIAGIAVRTAGKRSFRRMGALDVIERVPLDRWDSDRAEGADSHISALDGRFGGFVSGWADFDCHAFGITRPEAAVMDPQQRTLLEVGPLP